ncbi:hypothetical protein CEXT_659551 [Caerostris extrusa]|uniref:Uncharacterized protein n=1 Tax=Caerostris extrusa TaxID=172846 RepID=A0AAV4PHU4_CAEEX|nr:hypothetical protein CEXT_659551 [Caerostris extrusa]
MSVDSKEPEPPMYEDISDPEEEEFVEKALSRIEYPTMNHPFFNEESYHYPRQKNISYMNFPPTYRQAPHFYIFPQLSNAFFAFKSEINGNQYWSDIKVLGNFPSAIYAPPQVFSVYNLERNGNGLPYPSCVIEDSNLRNNSTSEETQSTSRINSEEIQLTKNRDSEQLAENSVSEQSTDNSDPEECKHFLASVEDIFPDRQHDTDWYEIHSPLLKLQALSPESSDPTIYGSVPLNEDSVLESLKYREMLYKEELHTTANHASAEIAETERDLHFPKRESNYYGEEQDLQEYLAVTLDNGRNLMWGDKEGQSGDTFLDNNRGTFSFYSEEENNFDVNNHMLNVTDELFHPNGKHTPFHQSVTTEVGCLTEIGY